MSCACSKFDPKHADKNNQDILTGDLEIISNSKLKKLIFKGLKYRETVNISWQEAKTQIDISLSEYIGQLFSNKSVNVCNFC